MAVTVGKWRPAQDQALGLEILRRAFFMGECTANMKVSNEPCCRCKQAAETILHLFYDCINSQDRWCQLQERVLANRAGFKVPHDLLDIVDEALSSKKHGGSLIYILYSITNSIWMDRNQTYFRNQPQTTPLFISLEQARVEITANFSKESSNTCWMQGLKALRELNDLLEIPLDQMAQLTDRSVNAGGRT
ncbi:hypothetical protein R1flu_006540 [Riccia fluitans]|uniref:Reverse transcriptase zinc-binding domain-containing protein n=1 Tax=Riccia fluitans TaxID=41844 RepID=A0ABD1YWY5_9MARC